MPLRGSRRIRRSRRLVSWSVNHRYTSDFAAKDVIKERSGGGCESVSEPDVASIQDSYSFKLHGIESPTVISCIVAIASDNIRLVSFGIRVPFSHPN